MSPPSSDQELDAQASPRSGQRGTQRTFLGLTHNPFTPPREGFFPGGDRKTHLEHLRHLSQWSRRILVVSGPFGVGKSSLFRELSGSLEPNAKAARLAGTVITSEREALVGLLQGFGIGADNNAHANDLADLVVRHVDEQEEHRRVCMVMVDDAHLLDLQAIQRLVSLVARSGLRLLLFTEANLVSALDQAAKKHELEWFEIRLTGFPRADVRDYLEWRFRQAEYRGLLPFSDEQLEKIVSRSGGNPSVIDSMANRLLAEMESGEIRRARPQFPVLHASLAVLLAMLVALVYMFLQDERESLQLASEVAQDVPKVEEQANSPASTVLPPLDDATTVATAQGAATQTAQPVDQQVDQQADDQLNQLSIEQPINQPIEQPVEQPIEPPEDQAVAQQQQPEQLEQQSAQLDESQPEVERIEEVVTPQQSANEQETDTGLPVSSAAEGDTPEPVATEAVAMESDTVPIVESRTLVEAPQTAAPVEMAPEQADSDEGQQQALARLKDGAWLLSQNPERFTLQMLTLSSAERVVRFVQRQTNPQEFAVYRIRRDGKRLYVVTYGIFSGKSAAEQAANNLTGELAGIKPWVRPLRLVQQTIRDTPQS